MEIVIFTEPQTGASYDDLLTVAQASERLGFDGFFRSDHYMNFGPTSGLPGSTDAWTTLAGLARETTTLRLGTLVTAVTFRQPGPLAISVAQVDAMSGGRVELGIGAGWFEGEHAAYGVPFPPLKERFDRLEDALAIVTGLWDTPVGSTFDYDGRHWTVKDSPALPKPVQQPRPPIILGGNGAQRTPALTARFAQEFNVPMVTPEDYLVRKVRVEAACEAIGRDPATMKWSVALILCCGADEAEVQRRGEAIGRDADDLRRYQAAGLPQEVIDNIGRYAEIGVSRVYLQTLDLYDLDHLELVSQAVLPELLA